MSGKGVRPCKHTTPHPESCRVCWWCVQPGEKGQAYRTLWGEPEPATRRIATTTDCRYRSESTGETVQCPTCRGHVELKLFACAIHGRCTVGKSVPGVACCPCPDRLPPVESQPVSTRRWAYGVTTVPERRQDLLPRTLASLKAGGFDRPRLFVDGTRDHFGWQEEFPMCEITIRWPTVRTAASWTLALAELYYRDHTAERYAIFQDDLVCIKNLRTYLERCPWPEKGYLNCFTFRENENVIRGKPFGWHEAHELTDGATYHGRKQQSGRGAVALVFDRAGVMALLASSHMVERVHDQSRGWRRIDGGVVESMNKAGFREMVHNPSLVQHTGMVSSIGHRPQRLAASFPGENFNALALLAAKAAP